MTEQNYEYRRERVMAHMRGQGMPTVALIRWMAESFAKGAVVVEEYPKEHRFVLRFVGVAGVPPHIGDLIEAVRQFTPAQLGFGFAYTQTTHSELAVLTHSKLGVMLHQQLKRP